MPTGYQARHAGLLQWALAGPGFVPLDMDLDMGQHELRASWKLACWAVGRQLRVPLGGGLAWAVAQALSVRVCWLGSSYLLTQPSNANP